MSSQSATARWCKQNKSIWEARLRRADPVVRCLSTLPYERRHLWEGTIILGSHKHALIGKMIDFIFQVDLSTIYIIQRRDFLSIHDPIGALSPPLHGKFYYDVAEANQMARGHCMREAGRRGMDDATVVHCEKEGMYRGGWYATPVGGAGGGRFEVRVRKLRNGGLSGKGEVERERRMRPRSGSSGTHVRRSFDGVRPRSFGSTNLMAVAEEKSEQQQQQVEEEQTETSRSSSREERRGSRMGRLWDSIRRK